MSAKLSWSDWGQVATVASIAGAFIVWAIRYPVRRLAEFLHRKLGDVAYAREWKAIEQTAVDVSGLKESTARLETRLDGIGETSAATRASVDAIREVIDLHTVAVNENIRLLSSQVGELRGEVRASRGIHAVGKLSPE